MPYLMSSLNFFYPMGQAREGIRLIKVIEKEKKITKIDNIFLIKKKNGVKSGCLYGEELDSMLGGGLLCVDLWGYPQCLTIQFEMCGLPIHCGWRCPLTQGQGAC